MDMDMDMDMSSGNSIHFIYSFESESLCHFNIKFAFTTVKNCIKFNQIWFNQLIVLLNFSCFVIQLFCRFFLSKFNFNNIINANDNITFGQSYYYFDTLTTTKITTTPTTTTTSHHFTLPFINRIENKCK